MKNISSHLYYFILLITTCLTLTSKAQSFYEDVAPILYDHCTHCHRPGDIAPFPLITYGDALTNGFSIQAAIYNNHPAWPPDANYHHYSHEDILTPAEVTLISNWVDNGMPAGDINNAPPGPVYANESYIADPDTALSMSQQYAIPGDDSDHYRLFVIPTGFTQEKFVRALEFRPGIAQYIHHAFISVDTTGILAQADVAGVGYGLEVDSVAPFNSSRLLTLYHSGDRVQLFPQGMGFRIPAQSDLILEIHFLPRQSPTDDSAWVNVFFVDTNMVQEVHTIAANEFDLAEPQFFLPANQVPAMHHYLNICSEWSLLSISPQMNVIGKSIKVFTVTPSNDTVPLVRIPHWLNNYQYLYYFPVPELIVSNSNLFSEGIFDNTVNNPDNPNDPPLNWSHDCYAIDDDFRIYMQLVGSIGCMIPSDCFSTSGIQENEAVLQSSSLQPNPAHEQSEISFFLSKNSSLSITLYDLQGRKMKELIQNENYISGSHSITLYLNDLLPGIYFCEMKTEAGRVVKKLVIQK